MYYRFVLKMTPEATLAHLELADSDFSHAESRLDAARGTLAGLVLGAALWAVALVLVLSRFIS